MAGRILLTGFPGFLGSELVRRILARPAARRVVCLVQEKFADVARRRADAIVREAGVAPSRLSLVSGDITRPALGLAAAAKLADDVSEVFHFAAVYDLSVPRAPAMRINVEGTRNVLDFAADCKQLDRLDRKSVV